MTEQKIITKLQPLPTLLVKESFKTILVGATGIAVSDQASFNLVAIS